jgi:hypothetical protein
MPIPLYFSCVLLLLLCSPHHLGHFPLRADIMEDALPLDMIGEIACQTASPLDYWATASTCRAFYSHLVADRSLVYMGMQKSGLWQDWYKVRSRKRKPLRKVPKKRQTPELCFYAVARNPRNYPHAMHTSPDMDLMAVAADWNNIQYVKEAALSEEVCYAAARHCHKPAAVDMYYKIPGHAWSDRLALALAEQIPGLVLHRVRPELQTLKMCFEAVLAAPHSLVAVAPCYRTENICSHAVSRHPSLFGVLTAAQQTPRVCSLVCMGGSDINWFKALAPEHAASPDFLLAVVKLLKDGQQNRRAIETIPVKHWTEAMYREIISKYPVFINSVPNPSRALCMLALSKKPSLLAVMRTQDADMCTAAFCDYRGETRLMVHARFITREMTMEYQLRQGRRELNGDAEARMIVFLLALNSAYHAHFGHSVPLAPELLDALTGPENVRYQTPCLALKWTIAECIDNIAQYAMM